MSLSTCRKTYQLTLQNTSISPFSSGSSSPTTASSGRRLSSTHSDSESFSAYSPGIWKDLDPKSAALRIIKFLSQKVSNAKTIEKFREALFIKRVERAPEKPCFNVEKIPAGEYPTLLNLITIWTDEIDDLKSHQKITESDLAKLNLSKGIISMIEPELLPGGQEHSRGKGKPNPTFFLVAKDPVTENIEAIACVIEPYQPRGSSLFKGHYEIDYLATAPKNLRLSFQTTCISGAATALIENIAYRTLRHTAQKSITVYSAPAALSFYEKLGFIRPKGTHVHTLSSDSLLQFLSRFGGISLGSSL